MSYGLGVDIGSVTLSAAVSVGGVTGMVRLGPDSVLLPSAVEPRPDGRPGASIPLDPSRVLPGHVFHWHRDDFAAYPSDLLPGHVFHRHLGDSTSFRLGENTFSAGDLHTALLSGVLQRVRARRGHLPDRIAVTHPSSWGPYRLERFVEVTRRAGVPPTDLVLVPEAQAVVVHHRAETGTDGTRPIAVYDAGGGSLNATVLLPSDDGSAGVIGVPETMDFLGSLDVEDLLSRYLNPRFGGTFSLLDPLALATLLRECTRVKEELSTRTEVDMVFQEQRHRVTREQLDRLVASYLRPGLPTLHRTLESAQVRATDLGQVLLAGGGAHMPLVAELLEEDLGRPVTPVREPQYAVALGAARLAAGDVPLPRPGPARAPFTRWPRSAHASDATPGARPGPGARR